MKASKFCRLLLENATFLAPFLLYAFCVDLRVVLRIEYLPIQVTVADFYSASS
jgi:hypothetical protein